MFTLKGFGFVTLAGILAIAALAVFAPEQRLIGVFVFLFVLAAGVATIANAGRN